MNYLLAKVNDRKEKYRKVISSFIACLLTCQVIMNIHPHINWKMTNGIQLAIFQRKNSALNS